MIDVRQVALGLVLTMVVGPAVACGEEHRPTDGEESAPTISVDAELSATVPVGPAPGAVSSPIARDAGVSVQLHDGSVVWFFGDSGQFDAEGHLTTFVIGSAAWAPADHPTVTQDALVEGHPVPFATLDEVTPSCPSEAPRHGVWPLAAVATRVGDRDRVVVWMASVCLGTSLAVASRGIAVGEWFYDPTDPPARRPIEVSVLEPSLFPDSTLGSAAVSFDDHVYVYGCASDAARGPACNVARVGFEDVGVASRYEHWDGHRWSTAGSSAAMTFEGSRSTPPPEGPLSVIRDDRSGLFLMITSPPPVYTDRAWVRAASHPEGPWSAPVSVALPHCADRVDSVVWACYGANGQGFLTSDGRLGIGYQDQRVDGSRWLGGFLVGTVRIDIKAMHGSMPGTPSGTTFRSNP